VYQKNHHLSKKKMPKHEEFIEAPFTDRKDTLSVCYQTFLQLGWEVTFAGESALLAYAPKNKIGFTQYKVQVTAGYNESHQFFVCSEMIHDEMVDVTGINKKRVQQFLDVLREQKERITATELENNHHSIVQLRAKTVAVIEEEVKQQQEIDKAMNLSTGTLHITYGIIAVNILVFILMALDGAGLFDANGLVHMKWGSNYKPLTQSGDWWRLITSVFIHFGVIHLLLNMYALYSVAAYLEPMLGKVKYAVAYLCTGLLASLTSLWWHTEPANSAGASGAVFGMYGLFLALLLSNLIPKQVRQALLQSIGIFIVYNLVYGLKGGVDNAAHIGGLISGFVIGYLYVFAIKKEKETEGVKVKWVVPVVAIVSCSAAFYYLQQNTSTQEERKQATTFIEAASFKDADAFNEAYNQFIDLQDEALKPLKDTVMATAEVVEKIRTVSIPKWDEAEIIARKLQQMNISEAQHKKADAVLTYVQLRKKDALLRMEYLSSPSDSSLNKIMQNNLALDTAVSLLQ
jgi:rhomboid protease GluP